MTASLLAGKKTPDAGALFAALKLRHSGDLIVGECKNGPTQTTRQLRKLDAWVLLSTWSPVTTIGYEIKVSRSDFVRDQKVDEYLGLCHSFYFVAPKGLIRLEELPEGTGLIEALGNGSRLVTRKRAARREIQMPVNLMTYVLMARVRVKEYEDHQGESKAWRMERLREWATTADDRHEVSNLVAAKIKRLIRAQQNDISDQRDRNNALASIKSRIEELGFKPDEPVWTWRIENHLKELTGAIDASGIVSALVRAEHAIKTLRETVEEKQLKQITPAAVAVAEEL